jgi:periplasmic protein TonB
MNKVLQMDQAEKVGLGAALGGHALLLALLLAGLFQAAREIGSDGGGSGGEGIAVSIMSETATEAAAPTAENLDIVPEIQEQAEVLPDPVPDIVREQKPQQKKVVPTPTPKPVRNPPKKGGFGSADWERRLAQQAEKDKGGRPGGRDDEGEGDGDGPTTKTAGQITREVNTILGPQITRYFRACMPNGPEVRRITTSVTLSLAPDGSLSSTSNVLQKGIGDGNRAEAPLVKTCVLNAIRKAGSPFKGLDPKDYSGWKTHRMTFSPN